MTIDDITNYILTLIPIGGAARMIILAISLMGDDSEETAIKKKMRNTLIFIAIATAALSLKKLIMLYYQ